MGAIRFLKPWSLYNPGETAGFDDETTATLIDAGIAVEADEAPVAKPAIKKGKKPAPAAEPEGESSTGNAEPATDAG